MANKKKDKKKIPLFKHWMIENGVTQRELRDRMAIGTGTANRLVNKGQASESMIRHLALELGIPLDEMKNLLKLP